MKNQLSSIKSKVKRFTEEGKTDKDFIGPGAYEQPSSLNEKKKFQRGNIPFFNTEAKGTQAHIDEIPGPGTYSANSVKKIL